MGVGQSKKLKSVQAEAISEAKSDKNHKKSNITLVQLFCQRAAIQVANFTERQGKKKSFLELLSFNGFETIKVSEDLKPTTNQGSTAHGPSCDGVNPTLDQLCPPMILSTQSQRVWDCHAVQHDAKSETPPIPFMGVLWPRVIACIIYIVILVKEVFTTSLENHKPVYLNQPNREEGDFLRYINNLHYRVILVVVV